MVTLAAAATELSSRERAINAAAAAKLTRFSRAFAPVEAHASKVISTFSKTCPPDIRFATISDSAIVKQLAFIAADTNKMQIMSCPIPAVGKNGEAVFAGSIGDSWDVICPATIRMRDARGDLVTICETRTEVDAFNLPTSPNDPLEENGPADPEHPDVVIVAAGPERIGIALNVPTKAPCFVSIPKVYPLTSGDTPFNDFSNTSIIDAETVPAVEPASMQALWYEGMRYGIRKLSNKSIHIVDTLFIYEGLEKEEFSNANRNLCAYFTTRVTYLTPNDELYQTVTNHVLEGRDRAMAKFGSNLLPAITALTQQAMPAAPNLVPTVQTHPGLDVKGMFDNFAETMNNIQTKSLTSDQREKLSEAEDIKHFYGLLFGSVRDVINEDGEATQSFVPASINPLFEPVLTATKNSKATKLMHEAVESTITELAMDDYHFATASNLFPRMFDQALVAAIRTGQLAYQHTALNPEGIKTDFGIHHLAAPRTWTAAYITRQQGELQLTQQEQVGEDKSRLNAKTTELYHKGVMSSISDLNEMIGNFYGLMKTIIIFDKDHPPLIWKEITLYDRVLRSRDGKDFTTRHRNIKEINFNLGQDYQSILACFVNEARKNQYKAALKSGAAISSLIFANATAQSTELRSRLTLAIMGSNPGVYKDTSVVFKLFQPEPTKEEKDKKKREASNDANPSTPSQRNRTSGGGYRSNSSNGGTNNVTPNGSPSSSTTNRRGKTVLVHAAPAPTRLPHPGPIFPSATRPEEFTILCCRSAYEGRYCTLPTCAFYHFPSNLSHVPREVKDKMRAWVANQANVSWHSDAINWINPQGNTSSRQPATPATPAAVVSFTD